MFLALFPLQLILFPGQEIPLHIFEPRYRQLVAECRDEGITFGIPAFFNGKVSTHGTEVELVNILKTHDTGEMDIVVRGLRIFAIKELQPDLTDKLYSGAEVAYVENDPAFNAGTQRDLIGRFAEVMRRIKRQPDLPEETPENVSFLIAAQVGLPFDQGLALIALYKESDRQEFLLKHLERVVEQLNKHETGEPKVAGNGRSSHVAG